MRNYIKPFIALLSMAVCLTACYDEENVNIGNTTVQFKEATMQVSEATTSLNIPIVVEGAHHSTVKVHVEYTEAFGLKDDENVIITSRDLLIPVDVSEVQLETRLSVSNEEIENGRVLSFTITGVEGANLGSNTTCEVNLRESSPIEGSYVLSGMDPFEGYFATGMACTLLMSESDPDMLELDFGYGATIPVAMQAAETEGDYYLTIQGDNFAGMYFDTYELTFCYAIYQSGGLAYSTQDISAYFELATRTITILPMGAGYGAGILAPSAGWLEAYIAWTDDSGELVPAQFIKQ